MTSWLRQVVHVLRYDARAMWPFFALHVCVLVYGVLQARGELPVRDGLNSAPLLLYGSAMLFAALLLHRHAPNSPVAHWSALPQKETAVWAAKWSMLAALLGCGLTATTLAIGDLPLSEERASAYVMMKITTLCTVIASAALVGALNRKLRTVLLLLLGLPLAATVLFLLSVFTGPIGATIAFNFGGLNSPGVLLLGTAGAMLLTLRMYRRRGAPEVSAVWVLSGAVILMAGAMSASDPYSREARVNPSTVRIMPMLEELANVTVTTIDDEVSDPVLNSPDERALLLRMEGAPSDLRAEWSSSSKRVVRTRLSMSYIGSGTGRPLYTPPLPIQPTPVWLGASGSDDSISPLEQTEWNVRSAVTRKGGEQLSVSAAVRFSRPTVVARLPLADGALVESATRQFRIFKRGGGQLFCDEPQLVELCGATYPEGAVIRLQLRESNSAAPDLSFALVNTERGEAIRTNGRIDKRRDYSSHQMFVPSGVWINEWLLVPGPYVTSANEKASLPIDEQWLRGAELVVIDWVVVGELPVEMPKRAMAGTQ